MRDALATVCDPEMGRALTKTGFVAGVTIDGGRVHVWLRRPAYFEARHLFPLLAADVKAAVGAVSWVASVEVCLAGGPEPSDGAVGALSPAPGAAVEKSRHAYRIRAFLARQYDILRDLLADGMRPPDLCRVRLGALRPGPATAVYRQRRAELGLPMEHDAPLVVHHDGMPVDPLDIGEYLVYIRTAARLTPA